MVECFCCKEWGSDNVAATVLAPQDYQDYPFEVDEMIHYIPLCEAHLGGWFDGASEFVKQFKVIPIVHAKEK